MEISNSYINYAQQTQTTRAEKKTDSTFKVDGTDNSDENKYSGYEQYIKNYSRILEKAEGYSSENAIERTKEYIDNPNSFPTFFPVGANLTDEFTDSFLETYNDLSHDDQVHLTVHMAITTFDSIEFERSSTEPKYTITNTNNKEIYDSEESIKMNFEDRIAKLTNVGVDRDKKLIAIYEKLLSSFENNIKESEIEKKSLLNQYMKY